MTASQHAIPPPAPGSSGLTLLSEALSFLRDPQTFVTCHIRKHGPIFRTHLFGRSTTIATTHSSTKSILQCPHHDAAQAYEEFLTDIYPPNSLLFSPAQSALRARQTALLQRALCENAHAYLSAIREAGEAAINDISPGRIHVYETCKTVAERVMTRVILGKLNETEYVGARTAASAQLAGVSGVPGLARFGVGARLRARKGYDELRGMGVAAAKRGGKDCVAGVLGSEAGVEETGDLVALLMSGVICKSIASGLTSVILHADGLQMEREEVASVLTECLRLFPPVATGARWGGEEGRGGVNVGGWRVEKGERVWGSIWHANRDEEVFQQADRFNRERWRGMTEECAFKDGEVLSFGVGDRACKGRQLAWSVMMECMMLFLRRFEVITEGGTQQRHGCKFVLVPVLKRINHNCVLIRVRHGHVGARQCGQVGTNHVV